MHAVLLDHDGELTLIVAGFPGKADVVWRAVDRLGRRRSSLRYLILTHAHPNHIGSAAVIVAETGATTYIGAADPAIARSDGPFRPMLPVPGLLNRLGFSMAMRSNGNVEPVMIDHVVPDGDELDFAGGLTVVGTPGHCAGQVALLWKRDALLIAGDVCTNLFGLGGPVGYEKEALGRESQRKIACLHSNAAAFGRGRPITSRASERMRRRWLDDTG